MDFAPSGKEFVSGSFDKTIQIFEVNKGKSRETYHGKRMQKVFSVAWSADNKYIFSGSEDTNIRVWKAESHAKIGNISERETNSIEYRNKLVDRFKYTKEIKKVKKSHLPKYLLTDKRKKHKIRESKHQKMENMRVNNEAEFEEPQPERFRKVLHQE